MPLKVKIAIGALALLGSACHVPDTIVTGGPACYEVDANSVSHTGQHWFFFPSDGPEIDHQGTHRVSLDECNGG